MASSTGTAGELKITAAIVERPAIEKILKHRGLEPRPPTGPQAREVMPQRAA